MPSARSLRFLAIPAAAGLAVVLVVACSDRNLATGPDAGAPLFAAGGTQFYDDKAGACRNDDALIDPNYPLWDASYDVNGNNQYCLKTTASGGPKKH